MHGISEKGLCRCIATGPLLGSIALDIVICAQLHRLNNILL
jgi:hypothetical protein